MGRLSSLKRLYLSYNQLAGEIPLELGRLSGLERLGLSNNQLTGGIPPELGDITHLEHLYLSGNELMGEIPAELGRLSSLKNLGLGNNQLTGEIPPELGDLSNLEWLRIGGNELTGCIPWGLQDVEDSDLDELGLRHCEQAISRLERVKDRESVVCGGRIDAPGFGFLDANGRVDGFHIDLCRAVAAAIFADPDKLEVMQVRAADRGPIIQSGEVDIMVRSVTWTTFRDTYWGDYTITMFYDGQGFMVRKDAGFETILDLEGATICVLSGTTTELNLHKYFRKHGLELHVLNFVDMLSTWNAYEEGWCDALTHDRSQLAMSTIGLSNPEEHTILPETISKEPLAPLVPHGDDQWVDIVRTVMAVLINAEELGITQFNVDNMRNREVVSFV